MPKVATSFSIVASGARELSGCDSSAEVEMQRAEGEGQMIELSGRSAVLFIIAMIAATVVTGEATYYVITRFVFDDRNDPITKAGGLSPDQQGAVRKK